MEEKQIDEMAEMLEIIAKAREDYANDVTDRTENEYIREGLLDAGYVKQSVGKWIFKLSFVGYNIYECSVCGRQKTLFEKENATERFPYCHCGAKMKGE